MMHSDRQNTIATDGEAKKNSRGAQRTPASSRRQWVADKIFGYDLFISYSWGDASHYADTLTEDLEKRGFVCFLDKNQYGAGDDLKTATRRALAKTGALVVVLSAEALRSKYVRQEVEIFRPCGRKIIVIDTQNIRNRYPDAELLAMVGEDVLDIRKDVGSLEHGPSDSVAAEISKSFNLTRQDIRRTRWLVAITVLLLVLFVSATVLAWLANKGRIDVKIQRDEARHQRTEAQQQTQIARQRLKEAISKQLAMRAISSKDRDLALSLLLAVEGIRIDDNSETRDSLLRVLQSARGVQRFFHPYDTPRGVGMGIGVAPNGKYMAYKIAKDVVGIYDVQSDVARSILIPTDQRRLLPSAISPDGRSFACTRQVDEDADGIARKVEIRETLSGRVQKTYHCESEGRLRCGVDPGVYATSNPVPLIGSRISMNGEGELIHLGSAYSSRCALSPDARKMLCFAPDSFAFEEDGPAIAVLWDLSSCKEIAQIHAPLMSLSTVAFSPDARFIAGIDRDGMVKVWDLYTGKLHFPSSHFNTKATSVAFHPDRKTLAIAGTDSHVGLWDIESGRELLRWQSGDSFSIDKMVFSEDGNWLISVGKANKVTVWDLRAVSRATELVVSDFALPQNDPTLRAALQQSVARRKRPAVQTSSSPSEDIEFQSPFCLSSDGGLLAVSTGFGVVAVLDLGQKRILSAPDYQDRLAALAFDKENYLLAVTDGRALRTSFLNGDTQTETIAELPNSAGRGVAISPDCSTVAFLMHGPDDKVIFRLWDIRGLAFRAETELILPSDVGRLLGGSCPRRFVTVEGLAMWQIRGASQLPDTIRVWDAATGKLATAPLNSENVFQGGEACWESAVALSSDCRYLAGLRPDGTVTLFDIDARQPLGEPLWRADNSDQSERYVLGGTLEYLNDGKILAAARGKHIVLLDTDIESWKSKACKKANRNLTEDEWKRYIGPETPYEKTCPELP